MKVVLQNSCTPGKRCCQQTLVAVFVQYLAFLVEETSIYCATWFKNFTRIMDSSNPKQLYGHRGSMLGQPRPGQVKVEETQGSNCSCDLQRHCRSSQQGIT
ncbi:uncharacterized protein [Littorina saxatilis]|uniref:uncharacterized protein n=1 Tax=Littorina saxatilis TaxID=31220 RepID=UPI0038B4D092